MRIFSKFHDYYDSVLAHGIDPNCVYVRKNQEIYNEKDPSWKLIFENKLISEAWEDMPYPKDRFSRHYKNSGEFSTENVLVLFCGQLYVGFQLCSDSIMTYCYNYDCVENIFLTHDWKWDSDEKGKNQRKKSYRWRFNKDFSEDYMKKFFNKYNKVKEDSFIELHSQLDVPIVVLHTHSGRHTKIQLNPILREIEFYKVLDPYLAFQEVSMFISGIMGGKSPKMVEIDDKYRKEMHGFDEWSFRKKSTN